MCEQNEEFRNVQGAGTLQEELNTESSDVDICLLWIHNKPNKYEVFIISAEVQFFHPSWGNIQNMSSIPVSFYIYIFFPILLFKIYVEMIII